MVSATLKTKIMIDKKKLIEELLDCVADATDTETQITSLTMAGMLMNEVLDEALTIPAVSGSFSQKDMENFAAKCMTLGHGGKTTKELLQDFCDNDR